jgi:hypothetical protein
MAPNVLIFSTATLNSSTSTVRELLCWCGAPSLTRGRVCRLQFLLAFASTVILESKSGGTRDHILLSQIQDSPTWRTRSPYLQPPGIGWPCNIPRHWIPFSSPPTSRRATVIRTRLNTGDSAVKVKVMLRPTVDAVWVCQAFVMTDGQSASLSWNKAPVWGLRPDLIMSDSCGFVDVGRSLWREDGSVVHNCCWSWPAQPFPGPSPVGLATIFYCVRFETFLFVASYDSQGYGGGFRPRLHTGFMTESALQGRL